MDPFTKHTGTIAVLNEDNIDTDRIMPARYLTRIERDGYGELLFHDVRGANFVLDQPEAKESTILVVGTNFGCGSSREHAVWGLQQAGFKAVIARKEPNSPGFGDIFRQNSSNCGLLLIELEPEVHQLAVAAGTGSEFNIDLANQSVVGPQFEASFSIAEATKNALLKGLDLVGITLAQEDKIGQYEATSSEYLSKV